MPATNIALLMLFSKSCQSQLAGIRAKYAKGASMTSTQFQQNLIPFPSCPHTSTLAFSPLPIVDVHKNFQLCQAKVSAFIIITRGQSNLTKSASRGAIARLGVTPGGSKFVQLNSCGVGVPISVP